MLEPSGAYRSIWIGIGRLRTLDESGNLCVCVCVRASCEPRTISNDQECRYISAGGTGADLPILSNKATANQWKHLRTPNCLSACLYILSSK